MNANDDVVVKSGVIGGSGVRNGSFFLMILTFRPLAQRFGLSFSDFFENEGGGVQIPGNLYA